MVDDEPSVRESLKRLLVSVRYQVVSAATPLEARQQLASQSVDAAVLDVRLADQNGWDIVAELQVTHPTLPIVVISASPNQHNHPLASTVAAVMEKPLDLGNFLATLARLTSPPSVNGPRRIPTRSTQP